MGPKTTAAWKAWIARLSSPHTDPRHLDFWDRTIEGLRKAGMPEGKAKAVGVLGETDRAGFGDSLQPRGNIHAVAQQVAIAFLDDVPEVDADAEVDPPVLRQAGVALDHRVLDLDSAAHRVDDAAKLDECAVASALYDATVMHGDRWVDDIAAQGAQPRERAIFAYAGQSAEADDVGGQDCY